MYFFPINNLSDQKHVVHCGMRNPHPLKVRNYAVCLTNINEYSAVFMGLNVNNKICDKELNEILLHSMTNGWGEQTFLQGFDFEAVPFLMVTNMFEHMEVVKSIYEGVVDPSTKNVTSNPGQKPTPV